MVGLYMIQRINQKNKSGQYKLALKSSASGQLLFICCDPLKRQYYFSHSVVYSDTFKTKFEAIDAFHSIIRRIGQVSVSLIYPLDNIIIFKKTDDEHDQDGNDK